jgi:hypothetical protein
VVKEPGLAGVVVENLPLPVLFGGPKVVPDPPEAVIAQIHREQPVEMGQPLFREKIERQRRPGRIRDSGGALPQLLVVRVRAFAFFGADQIDGIPQLPLPLVILHELADLGLKVPEHFELGKEFAG